MKPVAERTQRTRTDEGQPAAAAVRIPWLRIVGVAVVARAALLGVGLTSLWTYTGSITPSSVLDLWSQWDATNYLRVAEHGYTSTGPDAIFVGFFPGYRWWTL